MKTITFPVKGLNVAGCAREIEKRLGNQDGISQVEASYVTQTVTITFDDTHVSGFSRKSPPTVRRLRTARGQRHRIAELLQPTNMMAFETWGLQPIEILLP